MLQIGCTSFYEHKCLYIYISVAFHAGYVTGCTSFYEHKCLYICNIPCRVRNSVSKKRISKGKHIIRTVKIKSIQMLVKVSIGKLRFQ